MVMSVDKIWNNFSKEVTKKREIEKSIKEHFFLMEEHFTNLNAQVKVLQSKLSAQELVNYSFAEIESFNKNLEKLLKQQNAVIDFIKCILSEIKDDKFHGDLRDRTISTYVLDRQKYR